MRHASTTPLMYILSVQKRFNSLNDFCRRENRRKWNLGPNSYVFGCDEDQIIFNVRDLEKR